MDRYDGDGPRLHTLAATGLSAVLGPLALAAVLDGSSLLLGAVVVTGAAATWIGGARSLAGRPDAGQTGPLAPGTERLRADRRRVGADRRRGAARPA